MADSPQGSSGGEAAGRQANVADFTFEAGTLTRDKLDVVRFTGREGLSRLFEFHIEFYYNEDEGDIDPTTLVGAPCHLEIAHKAGARLVHGIVRRFEFLGETTSGRYYAADVTAKHWILTRRVASRIYQAHNCPDMTAKGIIKQALENAGMQENRDFKFATQGSFATREYCVQYRESDWDFICRVMEEEGIFYFFQHTSEGHVLMMGDSTVAYQETAGGGENATFPFKELTGMENPDEDEFVFALRDSHEVQPGRVAFDAYSFEQANTPLWAEKSADKFTDLSIVEFAGNYSEAGTGTSRSTARLQSFQCNRNVQQLSANIRQFIPGYKFTLSEHPRNALNQEYLVVEVTHTGQQTAAAAADASGAPPMTYQTHTRTVPAGVTWRPPRVTPRPKVYGSQTAIVTAGGADPDGSKDDYGRLKVLFFWDCEGAQDDTSSCWVRCAQPSAGGKYGVSFRPHKGQEVVVTFLDGDPDRPLITGAVYNSNCKPHYNPSQNATQTYIKSGNDSVTNEIVFDDKQGEEKFLVHAGWDYHFHTGNDRFETVEKKYHLTVKDDRLAKLDKNDHLLIAMDHNVGVGGTHSLDAGTDILTKAGTNMGHEAGQKIHLKAGMEIVLDAGMSISLKAGSSFITLGPAGVDISGPMVKINSGGSATAATAVQPNGPEEAEEALLSESGADSEYSRQQRPGGKSKPGDKPYTPPEIKPKPKPKPEPVFYEIQVLEDDDEPVANEAFRAELPDDTVVEGQTDANGFARFEGPAGYAEISLPNRENAEWRRIRVVGPGVDGAAPADDNDEEELQL